MIATKDKDTYKRTNEIKTAAPMLDAIDIKGRLITVDALLTQREFAKYLVEMRKAHYHFTVKANQKTLLQDIQYYFRDRKEPNFIEKSKLSYGRIETRKIWVTESLNEYLNFPYVGQAFAIERNVVNKRTGKTSQETIYGITSKSIKQSSADEVLKANRGHWCIESHHFIIDWNFDEDRSTIRTGFGSENCTRLRRFVIGVIKLKNLKKSIAQKMRVLSWNKRLVFDYLFMTKNSLKSKFLELRTN